MDRLPTEVLDLIGIHVQRCETRDWGWYDWNRDTWKPSWYADDKCWKKDIANLRLVSHQFNTIFSRLLFQNIEYNFDPRNIQYHCNYKPRTASEKLAELVKISNSKMCSYVESLKIRIQANATNNRANKRTARFIEDLCHSLPLCTQACHNIKELDMICPPTYPNKWQTEELIPVRHCDQINTTLATILTQINLEHLQHLTLRLPVAADFAAIIEHDLDPASFQSRQPLSTTLSRLRSLNLRICDSTSERGRRENPRPANLTKSGLAQQKRYEAQFFQIASLATAVESLEITCTVPLNLALLATGAQPKFRNLKILVLHRVEANGKDLIRLLAETSTTMERINFYQIELCSETWEEVCTQLCSSQLLYEVKISSCGYAPEGSSRHYVELQGPNEIPQSLETKRFRDVHALCDFVELVNLRRQRRGLSSMGCTWYSRDPRDVSGKRILRGSFWHTPEQDWFERLD